MPALKALHLRIHRRLRPVLFTIQTRDLRLVSEKLLELASHPSGVFVAGYFAQNFLELNVAPIRVLLLSFGYFLPLEPRDLGLRLAPAFSLSAFVDLVALAFFLGLVVG